jgi:PAS domain S-box-containing protein
MYGKIIKNKYLIVFLVLMGILFALSATSVTIQRFLYNIFYIIGSLTASLFLLSAYIKTNKAKRQPARLWLYFSIALFFWLLGDISWFILENILEREPFPSIADFFYTLSLPFFLIGLFTFPSPLVSGYKKVLSILEITVILLSTLFLTLYWFLVVYKSSPIKNIWILIVCVIYPVGNAIILWSFLLLYIRYRTVKLFAPLTFLFCSIVALLVSDSVYAYLSLVNKYQTGSLLDLGYFIGYYLIIIAARKQINNHQEVYKKDEKTNLLPINNYLITIFYMLVIIVLVIGFFNKVGFELKILGLGFLFVTLVVLLYHTLTVIQNKRLNDDLNKLNQNLEKSVQLKTRELEKKNIELIDQIQVKTKAETALITQLRYETGISRVMDSLLKDAPMDDTIPHALYNLRVAADVSRVYLFENFVAAGNLFTRQVFEVCKENVPCEMNNKALQHASYLPEFGRWKEMLSKGEIIKGNISTFPKQEQEILSSQKILSILIIPLFSNNEWYGFIGFDEIETQRDWIDWEINLLRTSADIIGEYIKSKNLQALLIHSEHKFKIVFENAVMGLYQTTPEGEIIMANPAVVKMLGFKSFDEIQQRGLNAADYQRKEERAFFLDKILGEGIVTCFESIWERKDGTIVYVRENARLIKDLETQKKYFVGTVENVTESKLTELKLKESENLLLTIMNHLPVYIWMTNEINKPVFFNDPWLEFRGKSMDNEFEGEWLKGIHPEDEGSYLEEFHKAILSQNKIEKDFRMLRYDGEYRWINNFAIPRYSSTGAFLGYVGVCTDITDRKNFENELETKNIQLKEVNSQKDKLLSIIGHDLKGHFNGILGFLKLLILNGSEYPENKKNHFLILTEESAQKAYDLLENLLNWGRAQSGHLNVTLNRVKLSNFADEVIKLYRNIAAVKNIQLTHTIQKDTYILADEYMLKTVLRNLIHNAIKFTPYGKITIDSFISENTLTLIITDTGIGMDQEELANLFRIDKNTIRKGTGGETGTGLGLLMCKEFVEKMGGNLWIECIPNGGCKVNLTFFVK